MNNFFGHPGKHFCSWNKREMDGYVAKFSIKPGRWKTEYSFFCAGCGRKKAASVFKGNPEKELARAWRKANKHLTRCPECGGWVCARCYPEKENCCIECSDKLFNRQFGDI